jgi:hypothetical protein
MATYKEGKATLRLQQGRAKDKIKTQPQETGVYKLLSVQNGATLGAYAIRRNGFSPPKRDNRLIIGANINALSG